ncbi:MAG: sigma-70 family RNA polymerase sigma factor [Heteroscytonema crispum UTEX LB 1556]
MSSEYLPEYYQPLLETPEYLRTVERIARKHTIGTSISWEDAAQTAYIKVFQAVQAGKFGKQGGKEFYHWAFKVAKNAIIDLVRKEKLYKCQSLDQKIPGTDLSLLDTVPDDFDLPEAIEYKDLLQRAIAAIKELEQYYPDRGYLKLWQGLKQGKNQSQLAAELGLNQGTISKRQKELCQRVAQKLGLFATENIKQELQVIRQTQTQRKRSDTKW